MLFFKRSPVVPVLRLSGPIGMATTLRPGLALTSVAGPIEKAFSLSKLPSVAVVINSPGGSIYAGLAAAALGANIVEVHTVFSRECFGPDTPASVTTAELGQLVEGVRFINTALQTPVDKDAAAAELAAAIARAA